MLDKKGEQALLESIRRAEKLTSGEIRVHIQDMCSPDPMKDAIEKFHSLGLTKTKERNGVLFFLASLDKKFAIIGDKGIQEKAGDQLWDEIKMMMQQHFSKGDFLAGLQSGIEAAGKALSLHFPYEKNDVNELPDDISRG